MKNHLLFIIVILGSLIFGERYAHGQNETEESVKLPPDDISGNLLHTPFDYALSPYTGYTRAHWLEITERIIAGVLPYFDNKTLLPEFPEITDGFADYMKNSQEINIPALRALERTMIVVIFYSKATGSDEVSGYKGSISEPYLRAIIEGTNPDSQFYWGDPQPGEQVGSVFAMAVYVNPELFWEPLTAEQKHNLLQWLKKQAYNKSYDNNFYFFHMAVVSLLEKNGFDSNREYLTQMYNRLFGWYQGDGWFLDGSNRGIDYYNIWAFQMYNQLIYKYDLVWREQFGERIKSSTTAFFGSFPYLFGRDGAQFAIRVSPVDGDARLLPVGQPFYKKSFMDQTTTKYDQHAYSSSIGFCTLGEGSSELGAGRTGYSFNDTTWYYRDRVRAIQIDPEHIISKYSLKSENDETPDYQLDELTTHTLIGNDGEIHIFWHSYPDSIYLSLGGYGIPVLSNNDFSEEKIERGTSIKSGQYYSIMQCLKTPLGKINVEILEPRQGWTASHLFGGKGAWEYWQSNKPVPPHEPVVIYVNATRGAGSLS